MIDANFAHVEHGRKPQARATIERRFEQETDAQKAKHREIAVRYERQRHRRAWINGFDPEHGPNLILNVRVADLECLFLHNWQGGVIQDDDAGREDIFIAAHHIAQYGDPARRIRAWLRIWAPWHSDSDTEALIVLVMRKPMRWSATTLGNRMRLTPETRKRLGITTIRAAGETDADIAKRRQQQKNDDKTARRREAGAVPRGEYEAASASRTKPWLAAGFKYRRAWERAGKPSAPGPATKPPKIAVASLGAPVKPIAAPGLATKRAAAPVATSERSKCGKISKGLSGAVEFARPVPTLNLPMFGTKVLPSVMPVLPAALCQQMIETAAAIRATWQPRCAAMGRVPQWPHGGPQPSATDRTMMMAKVVATADMRAINQCLAGMAAAEHHC